MAPQRDPDRSAWCEVLRAARANAGLTQEQVAQAAGLSRKTVANVEDGMTPQHATLHGLRTALRLPADLDLAREMVATGSDLGSQANLAERVTMLEKRIERLEMALTVAAHAYRGASLAMPELETNPAPDRT